MRISVTDRCDLRCIYCTERMLQRLTHYDILRYEEIERIVQAAARLGVKSLRITGGEPLVRPGVSQLVGLLSGVEGIQNITMTTNGTLLTRYARELKAAGLERVNVSLDTFQADKYKYITGSDKLKKVLEGIAAADKAGLTPVKINVVVMRGVNDDEILDFARKSIEDGWHVRFIEKMPLVGEGDSSGGMVSIEEIMTAIQGEFGSLEPCQTKSGNGPAKYYRLPGAEGTLGFIGPVTDCFCATCNRFRLTADGGLRPCLLEDDEIDLKGPLRSGASIDELEQLMRQAAAIKRQHHRLNEDFSVSKRKMWQIGG
jgi:cyclic pyranopterin phosphate synthase